MKKRTLLLGALLIASPVGGQELSIDAINSQTIYQVQATGFKARVTVKGAPGLPRDYVRLFKPDGTPGPWFYLDGTTGPDARLNDKRSVKNGAVQFTALPAGEYEVRAYKNGSTLAADLIGKPIKFTVRPKIGIDFTANNPVNVSRLGDKITVQRADGNEEIVIADANAEVVKLEVQIVSETQVAQSVP